MSTKLETLITGAIEWAEAGVPVFPCKRDKSPLTENGHLDATTDPKEIRQLFEFFGDAAEYVGARMGEESGLFVVDLDTYKPGVEAYAKGLRDQGLLPATRVHKTKNGGMHLFYKSDEQPNCKPHSGVEIKGEGGYVIVPPSAGYEILSEGVQAAPKGLLAEFAAARAARAMSSNDALEANILRGTDFHESMVQLAARYAREGFTQTDIQKKLVDMMNASVAASAHHPRHARWASIMRGEELARAVASANNKFNTNAASEAVREAVGDSAVGVADAAGFFGPPPTVGEEHAKEAETFTGEAWPFEGMGYFAHENINVKGGAFTLYPIYAENETVVIFAEPKTGKTALALTTALHIACGMDFGAFKVKGAGPCLYYGLEGKRAIELRVESWKRHMADEGREIPNHIPMFTVTKPANFIKEEVRKTEANRIIAADKFCKANEGGPLKVIFVDTLTKAMSGGDQNSVEDTSALFDLVTLVRDGGVVATIVFVHHKARGAGNPRGSTNIEAEPDVLLDVSKDGPIVNMRIARARSIEDGTSYQFMIHGYDLGENEQGFKQTGLYVDAVDKVNDDVASSAMVGAQDEIDKLSVIIGAAKGSGVADAKLVLQEWVRLKLFPHKGRRAPALTSAAVQQTMQTLVDSAQGRVFGEHAIRVNKEGESIVSFTVSHLS